MNNSIDFETAHRIMHLGNALVYYRNWIVDDEDLTSTQSEAISFILDQSSQRQVTASDVMAALQLSQSTVAGILKRLNDKGLIARTADEHDLRKSIIAPTQKGLDMKKMLHDGAMQVESVLLKGMSPSESIQFNLLLQRALNNITDFRSEHANMRSINIHASC